MGNDMDNTDQRQRSIPYILLLGVKVSLVSLDGLLTHIHQIIAHKGHEIIPHVNVHAINLAYTTPWLRNFFNDSTLVFCDGFGVKWGAKLCGNTVPERITYANWTWNLAAFAERHNLTLFFVGSKEGVAERAASRLQERHPQLKIVGTYHGYFDKVPGSVENNDVIERINAEQPDILIVGFGMPMQEQWLHENWDKIKANVALPGGAVFDYISGELQRGPAWMTEYGFEWLARLIIEPRRLWRRYIVGNPVFFARLLGERLNIIQVKA
jgi:N-acetylglucosaminyldiphosphoundecaprenol N-acetyl-beta-D-mannosaminyltransferase